MAPRKDDGLIQNMTAKARDAARSEDRPLFSADSEAEIQAELIGEPIEEAPPITITPQPIFVTTSGRYVYSRGLTVPVPFPPFAPIGFAAGEPIFSEDVNAIALYQREEVQFDVDGRYPQMAISGTRSGPLAIAAHWVASVTKTGPSTYEGPIWYKDGSANAIPHTNVKAVVTGGAFPSSRKLVITFSGGGAAAFSRTYAYDSAYHRKVEFEFDRVADAVAVTSIATHAHPNRPAALPSENLTLETVYRRAGFEVSKSGGDTVIGINVPGPDAKWTDQEMHDAMQVHWSRFANKPQWSLWTLFARLHVQGSNLGGIMFDDIGANHRQGTAIFSHAFIANAPAGDPAPAAWVERMRFWTAAHEMGHAFNLAHSWQKAASPNLPGNPWIPLANEPEARSFMNYPYNVGGGQTAFFANFDYRFSNAELLFMRHAPSRFVQMGNEDWFTNHGFREAAQNSNPDYELRLSVTAPDRRFAYLVPPVIEAALVNAGAKPKLVSGERLSSRSGLTLIINPENGPPRRWLPHLRHCGENEGRVLQPGEALYDSIMIGTGRNGWDMAEPGRYCIQATLELEGQLVYSNQLMVTVEPPASREEERLAPDVFTPEVGQVLAVNGSRAMEGVKDVLGNALELRENPISRLSAIALATPLSYRFKTLEEGDGAGLESASAAARPERRIEAYDADPQAVKELLDRATEGGADLLVNAMGHARYLRDAPVLAGILVEEVPVGVAAFDMIAESAAEPRPSLLPVSDALEATLRVKAASLSE
jgi:hypothetical protein